ncbi:MULTISPECIES: DUF6230 family protein [Catellatospora]|uniref:Cholesterol esterase n=2 Tax=Catellatospora TaxID=53365 RepID=A0A8J3P2F7_9ACTN|nr:MULTISPECIES: DUF6230 family protein [Catellatospora]RKE08718.1 hypothetical protein C8E86_3579 [Catellatospora citrea]GIF92706.1 cholesterol esterase [Catellatospora chokoriensis]GIG01546.1 cholesterol esterase [Catellatospora citrea]
MKDSQGNLVLGRTRWRRFAAVVIPATIAVSGLMAGVANGAVPVTFHVSGQTAKISADVLVAEGFSQYGGVVTEKNGTPHPVAMSAIKDATLTNLCQSVTTPIPGLGAVTLFIRAGREKGAPVTAENLLIGMDKLEGDAVFTNINIGADASELTAGGPHHGQAGLFGQEADRADIAGVKQVARLTQAGTFSLHGLSLTVSMDSTGCFAD